MERQAKYGIYKGGEYHGNQASCFTPGGLLIGWGPERNATKCHSVKGAREYIKDYGLPFGCEIVDLSGREPVTVATVKSYRRKVSTFFR